MTQRVDKVTVKVPATSANLGPGYDVLGLAMDLWLTVTIERAPEGQKESSVAMTGEGSNVIAASENLIITCFNDALRQCGVEPFAVKATVHNDIPFGCGCGSSSAATVAGVAAGFRMCGKTFSAKNEDLFQIVTKLEGHPDNAAPAVYGGMQLSLNTGARWATHRIRVPETLWLVLFVPAKKMKLHTHETRKLIPTTLSMADAIHNMARAALLVRSFEAGDLEALKECGDDRWHQQQRAPLFPHMNPAIEAAMRSGAVYSSLSGAGPSVIAFVPGRAGDTSLMNADEALCNVVAQAMVSAAEEAGVPGRAIVTAPSSHGAHIVANSPV